MAQLLRGIRRIGVVWAGSCLALSGGAFSSRFLKLNEFLVHHPYADRFSWAVFYLTGHSVCWLFLVSVLSFKGETFIRGLTYGSQT